MSNLATNEFLAILKSLYPIEFTPAADKVSAEVENPWYIVATVAFSASNRPESIPLVFKYVLQDLEALSASKKDKIRLVVKIREGLFKAGLISGYSRAISALIALYESTPEDLKEIKPVREVDNDKVSDIISRGDQLYEAMYGNTANSIQSLLDAIHPDMGWFSKAIGYGHVYNFPRILNQRDTSYAIVAALIAMDTPRQVGWHLANCRRGGASHQEVCAVREIAMRVASASGIEWRNGVPDVQEV